ncbi:unnamed protein product [Pseudo-nitzschia multistriata]|uniref:Uncharacterized protein n=1 Tax=Pseudo-nitzschia multistriata TaxID=183589 RepID=A0A448Z423_9STRA|nr:unnamed protein product [Pseudo-nitzschia multistriata]
MTGNSLQLFLFLVVVASEFYSRVEVANAFSISQPYSSPFRTAKSCGEHLRRNTGQMFSIPPPLSPISNNDDYDYDDFTTEEVTNMYNVIESLSQESNDDARRARLKQIMEVALAGPNGGPKRFTVLFDRVLTQMGEKVQQDARQEYAERSAAAAQNTEERSNDAPPDDPPSKPKPNEADGSVEATPRREKTPQELRLWALVDMMIQSKTIIKKHKF